jgi:hypothetical protein
LPGFIFSIRGHELNSLELSIVSPELIFANG